MHLYTLTSNILQLISVNLKYYKLITNKNLFYLMDIFQNSFGVVDLHLNVIYNDKPITHHTCLYHDIEKMLCQQLYS